MDVHGNISLAMRDNYNEYGVDEYYRKVASSYRNPFFPSIKQVVWAIMNEWWRHEPKSRPVRILDMAAGSGEVTECLDEWEQLGKSGQAVANAGAPSRAFIPPKARARSGQPPSLPADFAFDITATDPYTAPAYTARVKRPCHDLSFADLANGKVPPGVTVSTSPVWDITICSFALHLVPSAGELFNLLYELSSKTEWLIVIAPHKKPEIKDGWGWIRWDISTWSEAANAYELSGEQANSAELVREKTRLRIYRSVNLGE